MTGQLAVTIKNPTQLPELEYEEQTEISSAMNFLMSKKGYTTADELLQKNARE